MARPSKYSKALDNKICKGIAEGKSLVKTLSPKAMPSKATVYRWLASNDQFRDNYTHAREIQADHFADEVVEIADNEKDYQKAKNRIDARKWAAGVQKPKVYGNRQHIEHGGEVAVSYEDRIKRLRKKATV